MVGEEPYFTHVCRRMSEETGGLFGVSMSQHHLEELLMAHAPPPPLNEEATKVCVFLVCACLDRL